MNHENRGVSIGTFRLYALFALLLSGIAGVLLARYLIGPHAFAFADIGSDSFLQFYPVQTEFVRLMHEDGMIGWSHRIGLGAYYGPAMDSFSLLALLWPVEHQLDARAWIYSPRSCPADCCFWRICGKSVSRTATPFSARCAMRSTVISSSTANGIPMAPRCRYTPCCCWRSSAVCVPATADF